MLVMEETDHGTAYGICCRENGKDVLTIHDISPNRLTVEDMIEVFNNEKLSPIHLYDAVEDLLP